MIQIILLVFVVKYFISRYTPISEAALYTHPGMDDYWMSYGVHAKWMTTHSLMQCIKQSFIDAVYLYRTWDGNILSMFLTGLTPVAFNENRYHLVFIISFLDLAIGAGMAAYSLFHRRWKMPVINCVSIVMLFLIFYTDFAPSATEGIYWWPGIANYNLFFGMVLFAQGVLILYWEKRKAVWLIISSIVLFMVGLGNPMTGLVSVCLVAYELFYEIYRKKSFKTLLYIPFASALIGLLIVVAAPGNKSRMAAGDVAVIKVILDSFRYGTIMKKASVRPAVNLYLIMVAVISIFSFMTRKNMPAIKYDDKKKAVRADIKKIAETAVYVILMVCLYYASFAPLVYTGCDWYGRVLNTTTFVYFMVITATTICLSRTAAYFLVKLLGKINIYKSFKLLDLFNFLVGIGAIVCIIMFSMTISKNEKYSYGSLAKDAAWALEFRQAQLYDEQRDRIFMQLLDPNVDEVHIGEIVHIGFYPYIDNVIGHMEEYYGKKIIVD